MSLSEEKMGETGSLKFRRIIVSYSNMDNLGLLI